MKNKGYGPHDPRRCQAVEQRLLNDRTSHAHLAFVQCSQDKHDESVEHEWHGRKFGEGTRPQRKSTQPRRCPETEVRNIGRSQSRPVLRRVRCSLDIHDESVEHINRGREFGREQRRTPSRTHGTPIRCAATEVRNIERSLSKPPRLVEVQCALRPHDESVEHEHRGRKFGVPMRRGNGGVYKRKPRKVPWRYRKIHDNRWRAEQGLPPIEQTSVGSR